MAPDQVSVVQSSFRKIVPIADVASDMFYARLFERAPELRRLFAEDMTSQKTKLIQMLAAAVNGLHAPEGVLPALRALGARHVEYGVTAAMYAPVGAALLDTLEKALGAEWTEETAAAWAQTYAMISEVMQDAAATRAGT